MNYKVCILAAGKGSRMSNFTKVFNKGLLPINGKPAICHIIEKFPDEITFVIAVGYKKDSIVGYLSHNYVNRKFIFVVVDNWDGQGSGPGYSLLCCKKHLQLPFIQIAVDTLVIEEIPIPKTDWIGIASVKNTERFCTVRLNGKQISHFDDKISNNNAYAFIGLFGINNWKLFWHKMELQKDKIIDNEFQVSNGLSGLINHGLYSNIFKWYDVGTEESYLFAKNNFPNGKRYFGD